jgi:hypothetical protein
MWRIVAVAAVGLALLAAAGYDRRQRRRGLRLRDSRALLDESTHSRIDLNAVPYEPVRRAGGRDWATYRRRDRRPDRGEH